MLGREVAQGDVLAMVGYHTYGTYRLDLAKVIDGCPFALKLETYDTAYTGKPPETWVVSDVSRTVIVKRHVPTQADI